MARAADSVDPVPAAIQPLQDQLGYGFRRPELLALALTHRSWCAEHEGYESNERLEFLGDAVLGLVITDHIFTGYPALAEGELAKVRAAVVSAVALSEVAGGLDLGVALRLGRGEESTGGRAKPRVLADATEAVLGAVYLDGGLEAARRLVLALFTERIGEAATNPGIKDYKTRLQELAARRFDAPPDYLVVEEGPDHAKSFHATVSVAGTVRGEGEGRSKKAAQQAAARAAWTAIAYAAPSPSAPDTQEDRPRAQDPPDQPLVPVPPPASDPPSHPASASSDPASELRS